MQKIFTLIQVTLDGIMQAPLGLGARMNSTGLTHRMERVAYLVQQ